MLDYLSSYFLYQLPWNLFLIWKSKNAPLLFRLKYWNISYQLDQISELYDHEVKFNLGINAMIINNVVISLKCKHELVNCSLLQVTDTKLMKPYHVTHNKGRPT